MRCRATGVPYSIRVKYIIKWVFRAFRCVRNPLLRPLIRKLLALTRYRPLPCAISRYHAFSSSLILMFSCIVFRPHHMMGRLRIWQKSAKMPHRKYVCRRTRASLAWRIALESSLTKMIAYKILLFISSINNGISISNILG